MKEMGHASTDLTPREAEVLQLVRTGMRNKDIAQALGRAEDTIKQHLTSIFNKVGCSSRTELVFMTSPDLPNEDELRAELAAALADADRYQRMYHNAVRLLRSRGLAT